MEGESERDQSGSGRDQREGGGRAPWDAHDQRRRNDQMAPPEAACECFCLHCRRTFMSDRMWLQRARGSRDGFEGFWMCPTPNCSGAGFTFDIFPTDPNHPANEGWFDENAPEGQRVWEDDPEDEFAGLEEFDADDLNGEYDPDEPEYQLLNQFDDDDEDIEGEEWKYGLAPGERPKSQKGLADDDEPRTPEEEEALYNEPDRRPREVDWSDRERDEHFTDDDIPF